MVLVPALVFVPPPYRAPRGAYSGLPLLGVPTPRLPVRHPRWSACSASSVQLLLGCAPHVRCVAVHSRSCNVRITLLPLPFGARILGGPFAGRWQSRSSWSVPLRVSYPGPRLCLYVLGGGGLRPCVSMPGFRSRAFMGEGLCCRSSHLSGGAGQGWGERVFCSGLACWFSPSGGSDRPGRSAAPPGVWQLPAAAQAGRGVLLRGLGGHGDARASCVKLLCAARGGVSQPSVCAPCRAQRQFLTASFWPWRGLPPYCSG